MGLIIRSRIENLFETTSAILLWSGWLKILSAGEGLALPYLAPIFMESFSLNPGVSDDIFCQQGNRNLRIKPQCHFLVIFHMNTGIFPEMRSGSRLQANTWEMGDGIQFSLGGDGAGDGDVDGGARYRLFSSPGPVCASSLCRKGIWRPKTQYQNCTIGISGKHV